MQHRTRVREHGRDQELVLVDFIQCTECRHLSEDRGVAWGYPITTPPFAARQGFTER